MRILEQVHSREKSLRLRKKKKKSRPKQKRKHQTQSATVFGAPIIPVPRCFDLRDGDRSLIDAFFELLRNTLVKSPKCIYLSFVNTKVFKVMPTLVLYSIIDDAREELGVTTKINIMWAKGNKARDVNFNIRVSGEFLPAAERESKMKDCDLFPVIMGSNARANELSNKFVDSILEKHFPDADAEKEQQIASAIQETIDNVGRHAYPSLEDHTKKRWWFDCNRIGDNLYIAIYDRGIGIPSSLSKNNAVFLSRINMLYKEKYVDVIGEEVTVDNLSQLEMLKTWLNRNLSDGQLIRAAMHIDVTSTELDKHGQGSKSIKGLITSDENSYLLMYSNKGFYCYSKGTSDTDKSVENSDHVVPGTLIQWSI
ncbi:hypothetical protein [Vibrio nigripulchritudo]|uniref:hypothetical protein n=1 Tax=Vibrio nigripulchritudo TaxID=28173 RepID=UPI002492EE5A|nr:hypothetical protein [Vibrio nigripulchritudo]BDU38719.1 hypothetical protein TUMSATVNIG2_31880 [Vibrio nigripulchritudo]BDU44439.1 hypothetical protein TUMSATVNIG3_32370 [Vibrio nigripulchritudo]